MEKRRGFSTRLVMRDLICVVAQGGSRADQCGVHRSLGVTPKRQIRRLPSVVVVLRTPAALEIVALESRSVKWPVELHAFQLSHRLFMDEPIAGQQSLPLPGAGQ